MRGADSTQLADICDGLLAELKSEAGTTAAMQVLHFASREEDLSRRLLGLESFRLALEAAAECQATEPRIASNCRSALQLLHIRCTLQPVHEFACIFTGGTIRIAENRAFGGQSTCKQDGTLKTGGVVWDAAHCLVDLMHRLGPNSFRGKSVLELGAGCGYIGIVAAKMGGVVTVTDRIDHIQHLQRNVEMNGLEYSMRVAELEWAEPMAADVPAHFDWILASDCVYEEDSHRPLAQTLETFCRPDGATVVLISQETRSDKHSSFFTRGRYSSRSRHQAMAREKGLAYDDLEEGRWLPFVVAEVDQADFERPCWCHDQQDIRIYCLLCPCLAHEEMQTSTSARRQDEDCPPRAGCEASVSLGRGMSLAQLCWHVQRCDHRRTLTRKRMSDGACPAVGLAATGRPSPPDLDLLD